MSIALSKTLKNQQKNSLVRPFINSYEKIDEKISFALH